jgi:hypothetical protein
VATIVRAMKEFAYLPLAAAMSFSRSCIGAVSFHTSAPGLYRLVPDGSSPDNLWRGIGAALLGGVVWIAKF